MKILVTGAAGFIGFHVSLVLLQKNYTVVGLDSLNNYYDVDLKYARLNELGVPKNLGNQHHKTCTSTKFKNFSFIRCELENTTMLDEIFKNENFDIVVNLAAQAGVRYSLENPAAYISANIVGFFNVIECAKKYKINHFIYASSSSVYGLNTELPFKTSDNVDKPASFYAATKKSNELLAHTYSHLFQLKTTGLRFFTVYGPWGRPDMALFLFTKAILNNEEIKVFNNGEMERDFTFITDLTNAIVKIVEKQTPREAPYKIYNIGSNKPLKLLKFIALIEKELGQVAKKELLPLQAGDLLKTYADQEDLIKDYGNNSYTSIDVGIKSFIDWYKNYYTSDSTYD